MPDPENPVELSVHALGDALRSRALSSTHLVESLLARIREREPKLHAFVEVYADDALQAARAADKASSAGQPMGPLHGIPVAIKDIIDIEGRITTRGSAAIQRRATTTASVVDRLTAAGMIVIGKTHTVEFAMGGWGTNQHMGTPWNPWDLETARTPGGSSSGSAVAVASRMVPCAIGSDTGGSLRLPASWCGIVGFKSTVGRISTRGVLPLSTTLDSVGPLTRSVEDAALLFDVMKEPRTQSDARSAGGANSVCAGLKQGIAGMRIATLAEQDRRGIDPEVLDAYDQSIEIVQRLGASIVQLPLPRSFSDFARLVGEIMVPEGYAAVAEYVDDLALPLDDAVRARLLPGRDVSAATYLRSLAVRADVKEAFAVALSQVDAMLTPTTVTPAIALAAVDQMKAPSLFTRMANYLDLCALAIPNGITRGGLPTSLQLMCKSRDEATLLRIGWAIEQSTPWHRHAPAP
ncbi:MAG: amidase [Casimicrobiaceae bacterium]